MGKKDKYAEKKKKEEVVPAAVAAPIPSTSEPPAVPLPIAKLEKKHAEGKQGRKQLVEVNYLSMTAKKLISEAFHYDVDMKPVASRKFTAKALEVFMRTFFKDVAYAFDGKKNAYTNRKVGCDSESKEEKVKINVDAFTEKEYTIEFTYAATVNLDILKNYQQAPEGENFAPALACLDIILKSRFRNTIAQPFARNFYFPSQAGRVSLNPGMELWRGLYQSTVLGMSSLFLNVDVLNKAVPSEMTVLQYFQQLTNNRGGPPNNLRSNDAETAEEHLKGLRIIYEHKKSKGPHRKTVSGLGDSAERQSFLRDDNTTMTIKQYFKSIGVSLAFPLLPTILISSVDSKTDKIKNIFLPAEFCSIPGGQLNQKKCTDKCLQVMIKETAKPTNERKALIQDISRNFPLNDDTKKFGIEIASEFAKVMARIINSPMIKYSGGKAEAPKPNNGTWRDGKFVFASQKVMKFAIISCENISRSVLVDLKRDIAKASADRQMKLQDSNENIFVCNDTLKTNAALVKFLGTNLMDCKKLGFNFIIVIVTDDKCYSMVKKISERQVGILTQCLKTKCFYDNYARTYKMHYSTMNNIFLKINAKLNGTNHQVDDPSYNSIVDKASVMFIGADVTHPTSDQKGTTPSVAAVCASYDRFGMKYNQEWSLQKSGSDLIDDFEDMMLKHFTFYMAQSKITQGKETLPSKIIYYRDGVGESQFETFLVPETASLKRACQTVYSMMKMALPKITLIVVNKRHHMRAFPIDTKSGDGSRFNNVLPGTTIDSDIVDARYSQFFLASHSALQGCTRPAKYTVLLNESGISPDDLQKLTHVLCHMYVRCNRSVSYPNCTYYAHLMAFRGKHYIGGETLDMDNLKAESQKFALKPEVAAAHPMFFV